MPQKSLSTLLVLRVITEGYSNTSRRPRLSPKTLPGTVTKARSIPGSRGDGLILAVTHWPASQQHLAKQRRGEGAQQRFPPFPQVVISAAGASAGLTNTLQVPFASTFSVKHPRALPRGSLAARPPPSRLFPRPPGRAVHTQSLVLASLLTTA